MDIEKKPLSIREAMSWFHLEMMRALARSKNQEAEKDPQISQRQSDQHLGIVWTGERKEKAAQDKSRGFALNVWVDCVSIH